ncbi:BNR repeat-containing protein [Aestuariibaculum suncheonense]|uniref:BNR repeat-containing protein n=1 Tax=Aestuariibaculum suncheonense TaxID=1028745 RepID=A0A8J6QC59_9FLAO|nr:BNR repeat-containing protein [Aestuariibaculum suncheonense]MBD0834828.1 BNR repeat-containing protein [Aestuariibaculum suncheonense]
MRKIIFLKFNFFIIATSYFLCIVSCAQSVSYSYIGEGWSKNSVNTVKFRKNAITTHSGFQFVAYYDQDSFLVLGKRNAGTSVWNIVRTQYQGNTEDAHNAISLALDGDGYLHVSWDHHNTKLRYAKSKFPLSLELGEELSMTGLQEDQVTYPEFYNLPDGNMLFLYRSGESGRGNLVINSYDVITKTWTQIQSNLIDGENRRSAYWQAAIDDKGVIHLSWVWRETWDVETNHDLCYARSLDGGKTWEKSTSEVYNLPITLASAECAWKIPSNSNLINQTAITTDKTGHPYIVSYWNVEEIPQYQIVFLKDNIWEKVNTGFRTASFVLGGGGTKSIPISRPDILIKDDLVAVIFREASRGNKVSLAYSQNLQSKTPWKVIDLIEASVGQWEPNYDINLWNRKKRLHVFIQNVTQVDGEGLADRISSPIKTLEINNLKKFIKRKNK